VLLLGVWLSAAAIMPGCYRMSVDPPRDSDSKRALRVLKRHLTADLPLARFYLRQLPFTAPGYTLFAGENRSVRHGWVNYWVVRDDGGVVTTDPLAELSHAYRSLEAAGPEPMASPEELAWLAVALLERDTLLFDQQDYDGFTQRYDVGELAPPQLVGQGDAVLLVFWVYTAGRGMGMNRYELRISADYEVTVSMGPQVPIGHFLIEREAAAVTPP
jgi:hypothetical protein